MDLTPSHPSPAEDGPLGAQPPAQPAEPDPEVGTGASASAEVGTGTPSRVGREIGGKKFRVGTGDDYVPFRSRTKRRRRMIAAGAAGLVLLGAGAYGVVSLVSSPSQPTAAGNCAAHGTGAAGGTGGVTGSGTAAGSGSGSGSGAVSAVGRAASAQLPTASQITLNVYNSTARHGLAASTATVLKQRGFAIAKVTNDPLKANLTVAAQIRGGSASTSAMRVVAAEVAGAEVQPDTRTDGTVDLVLGTGFTALASPDQVSAALKAVPAVAAKGSGTCG